MNRVQWLVSKSLDIEAEQMCSPAAAFQQAVEVAGRYGTPAPATLSLARRILAATRRRMASRPGGRPSLDPGPHGHQAAQVIPFSGGADP